MWRLERQETWRDECAYRFPWPASFSGDRRAGLVPARGRAAEPFADGAVAPHEEARAGSRPQALRAHDAAGDADRCGRAIAAECAAHGRRARSVVRGSAPEG